MAFVQLDQAARSVGKSEVTIRRLVKSGKVEYRKQKTLTGFIYLVDPTEIRAYYKNRKDHVSPSSSEKIISDTEVREDEAESVTEEQTTEDTAPEEEEPSGQSAPKHIRVAVAGESGNLSEYWQKRAETYEERYHRELVRHAQAREELGVWRGRAEQAQELISKLLPANAATAQENEGSPEVDGAVSESVSVEQSGEGNTPKEDQATASTEQQVTIPTDSPAEPTVLPGRQLNESPASVWMYATIALLSVMTVSVVVALAYLITNR